MSLGIGGLVAVVLVILGVVGASYQRGQGAARWVPRLLIFLATAVAIGTAIAFGPAAWRDSGGFAVVLVGVPVLCCLVALVADLADRRRAISTTFAAAGLLIWSLITVVGLGLLFLPAALLLAAAAAVGWQGGRRPVEVETSRQPPTDHRISTS